MYYDVVILPPPKIRERIGRAVRASSRGRRSVYLVDNRRLIPHVSIFHIRTSKIGIAKIASAIERLVRVYQPITIHSRGISARSSRGMWLKLSNTKTLERLHGEVVGKCKTFKTGAMPWPHPERKPSKMEALYCKRYGSHHVLKYFKPHFTLAKFITREDVDAAAKKLRKFQCAFIADTIALCRVDCHYQVTSILKTFRLRKKLLENN